MDENEVPSNSIPNSSDIPLTKSLQSTENSDGTITTIEYRTNEDGSKVKVTRKIRRRLVVQTANHQVVERKVRKGLDIL